MEKKLGTTKPIRNALPDTAHSQTFASNYATYSNLKLKFMKKTLLVLTICLISNLTFGQKTEKINEDTKFSCSQKYGLTETKNDYVLNVFY
ncbi:hypothetical protein V2619_04845, partial [Tenacibaculum maritimum]